VNNSSGKSASDITVRIYVVNILVNNKNNFKSSFILNSPKIPISFV
jgi:hypothetical protein